MRDFHSRRTGSNPVGATAGSIGAILYIVDNNAVTVHVGSSPTSPTNHQSSSMCLSSQQRARVGTTYFFPQNSHCHGSLVKGSYSLEKFYYLSLRDFT